MVAKFRICDALSGRQKEINKAHSARIDSECNNRMILLYIPCFSLNTILNAINVSKVDYFSLDIEGGEFDVLKSINFDKIKIDSFSIEHNGITEAKESFIKYLDDKGLKNFKTDYQDVYFIKK